MITANEQKMISKVERDWNRFKVLRNKKKFDFDTKDGWITMLQREHFIDFLLKMLDKCKKEVTVYE
jgi:hypothetical protein